ncbi:TIM barrel protein [Methylomarinum sp. Ch1-1]|uniref:TIM barrel protein n=1 Tax=Methylomarinum roseum TaxID=3067653 RepID=A0AAU7NUZ2_9GAMM|nr:TIM barrel protein [Methylomarinum sp. Ch1-1]MDP4519090.1 TIM barrel protein [Methylomarinum sp. Ch1-1]
MLRFTANLSLLFTEVPLLERFQAAAEAGFKAVEIQFPYELNIDQIQQQLQRHHLKLVLFNVDADTLLQGGEGLAGVPEKQAQFREAVGQALEYARLLNPEVINVLPGRCINNERLPEYLTTFKDNLRHAANAFERIGVKTVFEAVNTVDMPGFMIHSGQQMLDILTELKHPNLAMQYDLYHMHRMGEDCDEFLCEHLAQIGHIQFADCPGRGEPCTGQTDFDRLFDIIAQSDYRGWTGAEYKPSGTTEDSLDWLRRYRLSAL